MIASAPSINIDQIAFQYVCDIYPEKNPDGTIRQFMPQGRYKNERGFALNKYGNGPFCKFKIPRNYTGSGVYAIMVATRIKYIGECANLSARFNMGYGNISPKNCFVGGQETNCRINNLIYHAANQGKDISLWFFATREYKYIEQKLRSSLELEWNRI